MKLLCDTRSPALRPVCVGFSDFPSGATLRSTNSATRSPALCSPASSLLSSHLTPPRRSSSARQLPWLWRPRPKRWAARRPPRSRPCTYIRAWVLGRRGALLNLTIAVQSVLPSASMRTSALRMIALSALNSPAHMHPCRRFARSLTRTTARLGERYGLVISFTTEDLHLLYLAS